MKTFKIFSCLAIALVFAQFSFAQSTTEKIPVSGNCGMCKNNIEKAALKAGAEKADWNKETKLLVVTYNNSSTNAAKIQQSIASAGYDTRDLKASDAAYDKLHACCKYDRTASVTKAEKASCCDPEKCTRETGCCAKGKCEMKDGKCTDMTACEGMDCCKNGTCAKKS